MTSQDKGKGLLCRCCFRPYPSTDNDGGGRKGLISSLSSHNCMVHVNSFATPPSCLLLSDSFIFSSSKSNGYCGFSQESGSWFRTQEMTSPYGPKGDHTNTTRMHSKRYDTSSPKFFFK